MAIMAAVVLQDKNHGVSDFKGVELRVLHPFFSCFKNFFFQIYTIIYILFRFYYINNNKLTFFRTRCCETSSFFCSHGIRGNMEFLFSALFFSSTHNNIYILPFILVLNYAYLNPLIWLGAATNSFK